jgi:hypothetical protein
VSKDCSLKSATVDDRKQELLAMICAEVNIHTRLEEEIFYPACRAAIGGDEENIMDEAQVERDTAKALAAEIAERKQELQRRAARM